MPSEGRGCVLRWRRITRSLVRENPTVLFLYGDNMMCLGYGGQAGEMRGEPNALGVPSKWAPAMDDASFFSDEDWKNPAVRWAVKSPFWRARAVLDQGWSVVVPNDGIGTGLADLPRRAPLIHAVIEDAIARLAEAAE